MITGLTIGSAFSSLHASGKIDNSKSGGRLTISQIRDQVDQLAISGQLTTEEQIHLIAAGFQNLNASDPSYQPAGQTGYTRLTNETIDFSGTLRSMGSFAAA